MAIDCLGWGFYPSLGKLESPRQSHDRVDAHSRCWRTRRPCGFIRPAPPCPKSCSAPSAPRPPPPPPSAMKRDAEGERGSAPPEFTSTHPSYDTRLSKFDEWMPDALAMFNEGGGSRCRGAREGMRRARAHAAEMAARRESMQYGVVKQGKIAGSTDRSVPRR